MKDNTIGIIGGKGRMGKWLNRFLSLRGFNVLISDVDAKKEQDDLIEQSETIIFSLPISITPKIIEEVSPSVKENQLLVSINSVNQVRSVNAMLKSSAEVLGLHPMFGPFVEDITNQVFVACKARVKDKTEGFLKIFKDAGAAVKISTTEEHDKMMSVIQVMNHFMCVTFARTLTDLGVDVEESLSYASPIYKLQMNLVGRILAQDPALYGEIAIEDEYKEKTLAAFLKASEDLLSIVKKGDKAGFIEYFNIAADHFGELRFDALDKTNKLIS